MTNAVKFLQQIQTYNSQFYKSHSYYTRIIIMVLQETQPEMKTKIRSIEINMLKNMCLIERQKNATIIAYEKISKIQILIIY